MTDTYVVRSDGIPRHAGSGRALLRGSHASGVKAERADAMVDFIGVNIHLAYTNTVYGSWDTGANIRQLILDLGIRHVRDHLYAGGWQGASRDSLYYTRLRELAAVGIHFSLIADAYPAFGNPVTDWTKLPTIYDWCDGALKVIENHNEPPAANVADVRTAQTSLYNAVKADSVLAANVEVATMPLITHLNLEDEYLGSANFDDSSTWAFDFGAVADLGNVHGYPGAAKPTFINGFLDFVTRVAREARAYRATFAGVAYNGGLNRLMLSECGYHTALAAGAKDNYAINERGQGMYTLRQFIEYKRMGFSRAYSYELIDQGTDTLQQEQMFGLYRNDGSPKPAATALKNFISTLSDPGPEQVTGNLNYTITGGDVDVKHSLLQKRDGTFYLLVWQDKSVWDRDAQVNLFPADQNVTLSFGSPVKSVRKIVPRTGSITSVPLSGSPQSATVAVPAEIVILEVVA